MGRHAIKACTAQSSDYKCVNCVNFNKHKGNEKVTENHSSLDKTCRSLQAAIQKYKLNNKKLIWQLLGHNIYRNEYIPETHPDKPETLKNSNR
jgi:hypothetical protein